LALSANLIKEFGLPVNSEQSTETLLSESEPLLEMEMYGIALAFVLPEDIAVAGVP
jgi:hypothetical protein